MSATYPEAWMLVDARWIEDCGLTATESQRLFEQATDHVFHGRIEEAKKIPFVGHVELGKPAD